MKTKLRGASLTMWVTVAATAAGALLAQPVPAPEREIVFSHEITFLPRPKWENGHLITADYRSSTVHLFDRAGRQVKQVKVAVPEAAQLMIREAALSAAGAIAVAGSATASDGASTTFIAWIDASGAIERIVRTSLFYAYRLCFAADGTLWAAGSVSPPMGSFDTPVHDVLRQYSHDGRLMRTAVPRESFISRSGRHPAADAHLVAAADAIAMYSVPAREWLELSPAGGIRGRWPGVDPGPDHRIMGVALTSAGSAYLSATPKGAPGSRDARIFKLDRLTGAWRLMDVSRALTIGDSGLIAGADDGRLVVLAKLPRFLWLSMPE